MSTENRISLAHCAYVLHHGPHVWVRDLDLVDVDGKKGEASATHEVGDITGLYKENF
jgi:hypothetical protein